jgi:hypothetical protein
MITSLPVPGYPEYHVTDAGGVFNAQTKKSLRQRNDGRGYLCIDLYKKGSCRTFKVHALVMLTFMGPTPKGYHIDHLDHDKSHNHLDNLRWRPISENSADCSKTSRKGARRVTDTIRQSILLMSSHGMQTSQIVEVTGLGASTVRRVLGRARV